MADLQRILLEAGSANDEVRRAAEQRLTQASLTSLGEYCKALSIELCNESISDEGIRQRAGLILKNAISAADAKTDAVLRDKWVTQLAPECKAFIKKEILDLMIRPASTSSLARRTACQLAAKIARFEVPLAQWPDFCPTVAAAINSPQSASEVKVAGHLTLGYFTEDVQKLCELWQRDLLSEELKQFVLTNLSHGLTDPDLAVRLAAMKGFSDAVLFAERFMGMREERRQLFGILLESLRIPGHVDLQKAAWEVLFQIASQYYDHIEELLPELMKLTFLKTSRLATDRDEEDVALSAIEFWSTVCDLEITLPPDTHTPNPNTHTPNPNAVLNPNAFNPNGVLNPNAFNANANASANTTANDLVDGSTNAGGGAMLGGGGANAAGKAGIGIGGSSATGGGGLLEGAEPPQLRRLNYISKYKDHLLPILYELCTLHADEDEDPDEWTPAHAAGTCVGLCAQSLGAEILPSALTFIEANFRHASWNRREAAVFIYGCIMEGPSTADLEPKLQASFSMLCQALDDPSPAVRDSCAWVIGAVARGHYVVIAPWLGPSEAWPVGLVQLLLPKLNDVPRVAKNVCFALFEIFAHCTQPMPMPTPTNAHPATVNTSVAAAMMMTPGAGGMSTVPLSSSSSSSMSLSTFDIKGEFKNLVNLLINVAHRPDANECQLRQAAFHALYMLIAETGDSVTNPETLSQLLAQFAGWIEKTTQIAYTEEVGELQGPLVGCVTALIEKLGKLGQTNPAARAQLVTNAPALVRIFLKVLQQGTVEHSSSVAKWSPAAEEIFLALSMLTVRLGPEFEPNLSLIAPSVCAAIIARENDNNVCAVAIELIGSLACALETRLKQYAVKFIELLMAAQRDRETKMHLRPKLVAALSDLCMSCPQEFSPSLRTFYEYLRLAASTKLASGPPEDEEWVRYLVDLRENTLLAYSAALVCIQDCLRTQGLSANGLRTLAEGEVQTQLTLINDVLTEPRATSSLRRAVINLLKDLVYMFKTDLVNHLRATPIIPALKDHLDDQTRDEFTQLEELVNRYTG